MGVGPTLAVPSSASSISTPMHALKTLLLPRGASFLALLGLCSYSGFAQESLLQTISRLAPSSAIRAQSEPESGPDSELVRQNLSEILKTLSGIKQLSMPIGPDASKPTMIFSGESVAIERRSVGFFKIGILPEIVLCDVRIRIMNSPEPMTWVAQLAAFFASEKSQSIKIRNLKIETRDGRYYLTAAEAFIPSLEKGFLLKQVEVSGENRQSRSAKALIPLQGVPLGNIIFTGSYTDVLSMSDSTLVSQKSGEPPTTLP